MQSACSSFFPSIARGSERKEKQANVVFHMSGTGYGYTVKYRMAGLARGTPECAGAALHGAGSAVPGWHSWESSRLTIIALQQALIFVRHYHVRLSLCEPHPGWCLRKSSSTSAVGAVPARAPQNCLSLSPGASSEKPPIGQGYLLYAEHPYKWLIANSRVLGPILWGFRATQ